MKSRHFSSDEVREPQVSVGAVRGWEPTGLPTSRLCSETAGRGQGILLSQRKGQEEGTKPQAPGPTAHRGSKGRMCLKKKKKKNPPAPFSETEEERKWRRPCSNYYDNYYQPLLQLSEQKKKKRKGPEVFSAFALHYMKVTPGHSEPLFLTERDGSFDGHNMYFPGPRRRVAG